jgi:hypothetical protein
MVTSPAGNSALEPKDGTQIKEQGQGKTDAIHSKASAFKGTHAMETHVVRIPTRQPTALQSWTASKKPIYRPEIKETRGKTNSVTTAELKALASAPSHLTRWDITQGFTKQTYPEGNVLVQCMNAIRSPNRKVAGTKRVLKLPIHSRLTKRARPTFSPITVPGTPENQLSTQRSEAVEDNQEEDLDLYYKV